MRSITIDFTKTPIEISNKTIGKKGEKNATQLIITPPEEMSAEDSGVVNYSVAFQIGAGKKKHSAVYEKAESITVPLGKDVTQVSVLSLQLEGYDGEENLIMKSELIKDLIFDDSVNGEEFENSAKSEIMEQIADINAKSHSHANAATLGALSEADGQLTYKGTAIGERPTNTVEALDELSATFRTDLAPFDAIAIGAFEGDFLFDKIPIGAEIKSIEFRLEGSTEWIDIKSMFEYDGIPHVINMNHAAWGYDYGMYDKMFALITFPNGTTNFLYDAAVGGNNGDIRITYYTGNVGGEDNA